MVKLYQFFAMKAFLNSHSTLSQIQNRLNKYAFLTKNNLPGYPDALVFLALTQMKKFPDPKQYPDFYHWYILMKQFSINTVNSWLKNLLPPQEDNLINHLLSLSQNHHQQATPAKADYSLDYIKEDSLQISQEGNAGEFIIDIWQGRIKQNCKDIMKRELRILRVRMIQDVMYGQKKIQMNGDSRRCEQALEVVERLMEYRRIEVKKRNKSKTVKKSLSAHYL